MVSSARRLQQLFDHVQKAGRASRPEALRLFPLARELAEARAKRGNYPTLCLFADWTLHSELDRTSARDLLTRIGAIVERHWANTTNQLPTEVSKEISVDRLRNELRQLLTDEGLPVFMLEPECWTQIASWLLQDLLDKPIIGSKFTSEEEETGWGKIPRVFRLVAEPGPGKPIMWEIDLGPRNKITGMLIRA